MAVPTDRRSPTARVSTVKPMVRTIEVSPVKSAADERAFRELPYHLYREDPLWVPPLRTSERQRWLPERKCLAWCALVSAVSSAGQRSARWSYCGDRRCGVLPTLGTSYGVFWILRMYRRRGGRGRAVRGSRICPAPEWQVACAGASEPQYARRSRVARGRVCLATRDPITL